MIDIAFTETGDLDLTTGDIVMTEPTGQHQCDILLASQGDFKESPITGVDSAAYINESDPFEYLRSARLQMTRDGMKIRDIYIDDQGEINIDGEYENH